MTAVNVAELSQMAEIKTLKVFEIVYRHVEESSKEKEILMLVKKQQHQTGCNYTAHRGTRQYQACTLM